MTKPSWQDFGTHDESAHPRLWDGVVGAWCPSLGPTGARLHDMSRRGNWGSLTNMDNATDWVIDDGQYALDFDGVNDQVTTTAQMPTTPNRSFGLWFRYNQTLATNAFDIAIYGGASSSGAAVFLGFATQSPNWGNTGFGLSQYGNAVAVEGFNDNRWHAGLVQHVGSLWSVYVDGVFRVSKTMTTVPSTGDAILIGNGQSGQQYQGLIDDVLIWDRALPPNEIAELYKLGRCGMYERKRRTLRRYVPEQATGARRRRILCGDYS